MDAQTVRFRYLLHLAVATVSRITTHLNSVLGPNSDFSVSTLLHSIFFLSRSNFHFYFSCFSFCTVSHPVSCNAVTAMSVVRRRSHCSAFPHSTFSAGQYSTTVFNFYGQWLGSNQTSRELQFVR